MVKTLSIVVIKFISDILKMNSKNLLVLSRLRAYDFFKVKTTK